jgi:hypothetical protein
MLIFFKELLFVIDLLVMLNILFVVLIAPILFRDRETEWEQLRPWHDVCVCLPIPLSIALRILSW